MIETERLRIRPLAPPDASFIVLLLNDPAFLRYIGDRGVRTEQDAVAYIENGPAASHARYGFGLSAVEGREDRTLMGMCGLLQRDELEAPDLGFAFLPPFRRRGFAREAADAVLGDASARLGITRVLAITQPDNAPSMALLDRLGFQFERLMRKGPADPELRVYVRVL